MAETEHARNIELCGLSLLQGSFRAGYISSFLDGLLFGNCALCL